MRSTYLGLCTAQARCTTSGIRYQNDCLENKTKQCESCSSHDQKAAAACLAPLVASGPPIKTAQGKALGPISCTPFPVPGAVHKGTALTLSNGTAQSLLLLLVLHSLLCWQKNVPPRSAWAHSKRGNNHLAHLTSGHFICVVPVWTPAPPSCSRLLEDAGIVLEHWVPISRWPKLWQPAQIPPAAPWA